ncbi:acyltransferase domain-containing protein [Azospirillum brasilense]|uniref:acyltransferase domain-containing protein n=1 Tax=Azospirillum brasilense TaxID=192 RepID=UPI0013B466A9|nr:acyltransferase domain-containing protein [Azospirillum brasilense]
MFAGQGSQYFRMGRSLYRGCPHFRSWLDRLDAVASVYVGHSILEVVHADDQPAGRPFDDILHSHPAIFMVQVALARALLAQGFPPPDAMIGASLGEFVAATVAGVASEESMLFDIIKQARLFDSHCGGGAMLVVIDDVATFGDPVFGSVALAGVNFDRCFVVSGRREDIGRIAAELGRRSVAHQILPVGVGFHSAEVDAVEEVFLSAFADRLYGPARIPVVSCAPLPDGGTGLAMDRFSPAYWWQVIRRPIAFRDAFDAFRRRHPDALYVDLSPSGTMASFVKYNMPTRDHGRVMAILSPFGQDLENLEAARALVRGAAARSLEGSVP